MCSYYTYSLSIATILLFLHCPISEKFWVILPGAVLDFAFSWALRIQSLSDQIGFSPSNPPSLDNDSKQNPFPGSFQDP